MKRKIIGIFCFITSVVCIGANLPKEYTQDSRKSCHTESYQEKVGEDCVCKKIDDSHIWCIPECTPKYETKTREVCSTEYYDVWTGKYVTRDIEASIVKHVEKEAELRYNAEKATAEQLFRAEKEHKTIEQVVNEDKQRFKDRSYSAQQSYSHYTGDDITKNERYRATINNREQDKIRKEDMDVAGEDAIKKSNKAANSKWIRKLHEDEYGIKSTDKYYNNEYGVDPVLPPIRVKDISEITEEMKKQGKPIFIEESKKPDTPSGGGSSSDNNTWDTPSYSYYTISYNKNGADSGSVPDSVTKRSDSSYVKIAGNYGNLIKEGFKFVGWNTKANGTGTTYDEGEYKRLYSDMILYAKWEKVEKVKPSKPIEHKTYYQITFINGDHVTITGNKSKTVEKGKAINYVPSIKVDNEFKFKCWLGSDGNTYTDNEVKELIPTSSINFLAIVEGGEKTQNVPKPQKVKEKYNITFTANEHSKLKGASNLEVEEQTKINNVPEVIADKGYAFKNWLGSDGNTYTTDAIKELTPTTDMSFLVVTEVDKNAKVIVPWETLTPANPIEKPKIGKKREKPFVQYIPIEVYVGDEVNVEDVVTSTSNGWDAMAKSWYFKPNTSKVGKATGGIISIIDLVSKQAWHDFPEVDTITVLPKPTLEYKEIRRKHINLEIVPDDVVKNKLNDRYKIEITNKIDIVTIGKKQVELKITDTKTGRVFTGYTTDITLYENLENLNYKPDPEIYEGDDTKVDDIIDKKDIPSKYNITIKIPADSKTPGRKITRIIISNPTSGSVWEVDRPITVLPKPTLVYKNPRKKHINLEIVPDDVVANKLDDRYRIEITNKIDIITIGTKPVELKIIDTKLNNREFTGFTTDITLYEDLLDLNYKPNPEIYVGDDTKVDDIIDKHDIPSIYKITIKIPADSNTPGRKTTKIIITNPTSGSVWEVDRPIEVIPEPELVGKDLWIYQNDKNPDDKGKQFINKITVDLNKRFEGRYVIKYKGHGDISKVGKTKFTYIITDLQKNRTFEKQIDIEVREEVITPKINENTERFIGHIYTTNELIEGIDKNIYIPEITNKDEMMEFRLTPGKKIVKVKITSTITGKVWTYDIPVIYKEKIVDLGELLWEKGEVLTIEDIRKQKNLPKDHTITLRKGDLDTSQLGSKMLELVIMDKDRVYYVGKLKLTIVENKTIEDIHKIDDGTKVHLITYVDDISNRATKKLIEKSKDKDLWFEQTNNFLKYNLDQKANILGGRIGYDHYFENQKAVLGGYVGYERATWNLSDVSKQNLFHMGIYGGKELYNTNNGKNKFYLGGVGQYTFINGTINIKNIRNERVSYKQTSHNILANGFIGLSHEYSKNSNIALNLGDTLLYSFNNKYIGKTQNVKLDNNIANEVYTEIIANKKWDRFNIYSNLKLGYLFGKTHYTLNKAVWDYTLKKFNIKISGGADYDITDNFTVGVEGWYKHHDKSIKLDAGCKAKFEYRW